MKEIEYIDKYCKPLTEGNKYALGLLDDAALLPSVSDDETLVIAADALVEDVHFFKGTDPKLIGKKLMGVNLSDMAAMGAQPLHYLVTGVVSKNLPDDWVKEFLSSFKEANQAYNISALGGDTVFSDMPISLSMTMIGKCKSKNVLMRSNAKVGDLVYVTGTIGDSAFGLKVLKGIIANISDENKKFLIDRYHIPQPRIDIGMKIANIASSCMDISDGLYHDVEKIAHCSNVSIEIEIDKIPLSDAVKEVIDQDQFLPLEGGDDYELIFTVPEEKVEELESLNLDVTQVGQVVEGAGVAVLDSNNKKIDRKFSGFTHYM